MRFDSLEAWLRWLESLHPKEIDLGLDRVKQVAQRLGLLSNNSKIVTVAGTNGKGSFVKVLSELLLSDGHTVGTYTSPHLLEYNERISVNGRYASDDAICLAFQAIDQARGDISLTYFEFGTLAALHVFQQVELEYIILEVGLGGRLDAVNIIDPDISVLTSVGLDHEAWLGHDRESIGREKAGILRESRPFICVEHDVPTSVLQRADALNCQSYYTGDQIGIEQNHLGVKVSCLGAGNKQHEFLLSEHQLPLPSIAAALQCYCLIRSEIEPKRVSKIVANCRLEGRFEQVQAGGSEFILDVAHNPQASVLLAEMLLKTQNRKIIAVFACMQDKNVAEIVKPLCELIDTWVCTEVPNLPRSLGAADLANELSRLGVNSKHENSPKAALDCALAENAASGRAVLVLGSFFLLAEIKPLLDTL